jgi:hypothetical protein
MVMMAKAGAKPIASNKPTSSARVEDERVGVRVMDAWTPCEGSTQAPEVEWPNDPAVYATTRGGSLGGSSRGGGGGRDVGWRLGGLEKIRWSKVEERMESGG